MTEIYINFDQNVGRVKLMHGVGQPPFVGTNFDMVRYLKDAGIPFSRLHDVGGRYGSMVYVDVENIFRNFDADENDPASFDFAFTDKLITALIQNGVEPFYRLGATIENDHRIKAYHIFPPRDNLKWARICAGIIRHYTEGWADGFHYQIRYWEIWNEPDNEEKIEDNPQWKGTKEQFYELYATAATYLKKEFPHLKIGGYGSCGFYALDNGLVSEANSSMRMDYFITFFEKFLEFVRERKAPLDFFSWHSYSGVEQNKVYTRYARETLDRFGFTETETFCNEWNPEVRTRGTAHHAAVIAKMMMMFAESQLDGAMFYDARYGISIYGSLFEPLTAKPFPAYYSFVAYNQLYTLKNRVYTQWDDNRLYCMAVAGERKCLMLANDSDEDIAIKLVSGELLNSCVLISSTKMMEPVAFENCIPANSVMLLEFQK